jgi:hypothetical protein
MSKTVAIVLNLVFFGIFVLVVLWLAKQDDDI